MAIQAEVIKSIEDGLEGIKTDLDARIDRKFDKLAQEMSASENAHLLGDGRGNRGNRNMLATLANDAGIQALANGNTKSAMVKLEGGVSLLTKSTIVGDTEGTSEDGYSVAPNRSSILANDPRRPLSLLDYLPRIRVTSNKFEYNRLTGYSNAAGYQTSEGALKPEASIPTDLMTANVATIAHWVPASEQVLADAPALQAQVRNLLGYGVLSKLERELILGAGGAGEIAGLTDSGNFTAYTGAQSGDSLADAVANIEASMLAAGWRPNLVIVHPDDWRDARRERADSGAGVYLAGSWRDPAPPSIWGIPVIVNAAVSAGNVLVLDTSQVAVLNRTDVTVELGRINDQFARNVVTLRAEMRAGLAVFSPGAVVYGDFEA